ncbi:hypothetical protein FRB90_007389, partial [Tulasnella sp. 427]
MECVICGNVYVEARDSRGFTTLQLESSPIASGSTVSRSAAEASVPGGASDGARPTVVTATSSKEHAATLGPAKANNQLSKGKGKAIGTNSETEKPGANETTTTFTPFYELSEPSSLLPLMAPFFKKPLFGKKKKHDTIVEEDHHYGGTDSHVYSLSNNDPYGHQQVHMTTTVPTKTPGRWKSVLRRKPLPATHEEVLVPAHDQHFIDSEYHPLTVSGPHTTGGPTVLPAVEGSLYEPTIHPVHHHQVISDGSSGASERHGLHRNHSHGSGVRRHQTGVSQVQTILPHDSASNIHVEYVPEHSGVRPLVGIVEEQSDVEYKSVKSQHTGHAHGHGHGHHGQQFVSTHPIGHGLHLHQVAPRENGRLAPLEVTDGHGRRQKVQEVILDGSGIQEIPMPADGNVIFIVEEGVTLDVKDPETGEYIPLEEWYRRLAERTPPKTQDRYIVVNGDASNIIVENADGEIIHRGERVKSEYIHRHEMERTHSHSSGGSRSRAASPNSGHHSHHQHIIDRKGRQISIKNTHHDPRLRLYTADPMSPGGKREHTDHLVITTPPKQPFQHPSVVSVRPPNHHRANSVDSSRSSSASSRSKRSSGSSQHAGHYPRGHNGLMTASEMETTPEASVLGVTAKPIDYFSIKPHGHQDPNGHPVENFETPPPTGVYLASIPEGSREFLPPKHHHSHASLAARSVGRSASHRSKASTAGGGFMAMPEPVHYGEDGQPLPPHGGSEFGHASAHNSPISYKSHKSKGRTASEIVMPSPHGSAAPSIIGTSMSNPPSRKSSKKKTRKDILIAQEPSPPPLPPIAMPEPETEFFPEVSSGHEFREEAPFVAPEEPSFFEVPAVQPIHEEHHRMPHPVPDGAVDLSSPPHTPSPYQPLSRTVSAKSKASKASKASKTSKSGWGGLWGGWGGGNKQEEEEEEAQEVEEEGGFPGGFSNPLTAQVTGASAHSRRTANPVSAQVTGASAMSRHTAAPLAAQATGGSAMSRHTATPLAPQPTGGSAVSRHASIRSNHGQASPPQNARGSPQRGLPAIPGSPLYDPYALPEESAPPSAAPLSIHTDVSRRPSLASRLNSASGSGRAPSLLSNRLAMPEPELNDPYPSPGGLPSVHDSFGSNRHTKHSGNMSFVQEPLEGEFAEPLVHVSPVEVDKDPATGSRRLSAVVSVTG